jgi:hypothetical protein
MWHFNADASALNQKEQVCDDLSSKLFVGIKNQYAPEVVIPFIAPMVSVHFGKKGSWWLRQLFMVFVVQTTL